MSLTTTTTDMTHPKIYVACLAAYNNGILHGAWIDAARDPWALYDDVRTMLAASPIAGSEEWAIHDDEGFGSLRIAESASLDRVTALAAFIAVHGTLGAALLAYFDGDLETTQQTMNDGYLGAYASLADYLQEVTEETTQIPAELRCYIDWQAMARYAELGGEFFTITTGWDVVHVFAGG